MKTVGTIVRGIRTPIIKEGDRLSDIVVNSLVEASKSENFSFNDKDVVAITEAVVSISDGNYATIDEVLELVENNKSGILFLGDSDSEWSTFGVKILNKVLNDKKIDMVYYFNPGTIKNKNNKKFKTITEHLNIEENSNLPIVYVIIDGKVVDHVDYPIHDDASIDDKNEKHLEEEYSDLISLYV